MAAKKLNPPNKPTRKSEKRSAPNSSTLKKTLEKLQATISGNLDDFTSLAMELAKKDEKAFESLLQKLHSSPARRQRKAKAAKTGSASRPASDMEFRFAKEAIFRELAASLKNASASQPTKVAFLGPLHSYSHLATLEAFGASVELVPVRSIAAVFDEVSTGHVTAGVVPIENSTDGRIVDTLERLTRAAVKICGEVPLAIHHNLLGIGKRSDITEVCSKPQAISQCREWLSQHLPEAKVVSMSSTTAAAERAAKRHALGQTHWSSSAGFP